MIFLFNLAFFGMLAFFSFVIALGFSCFLLGLFLR